MISNDLIKLTVKELLKTASTEIPKDVKDALMMAYVNEEKEIPKIQLKAMLENIDLASKMSVPICQDTGIPIIYVTLGNVEIDDIETAIKSAVEEATKSVPLRPNIVHPITRMNPGTNIGVHMPYINYKFSRKKCIEITVMPKGAGSENMSAFINLTPADGLKGVKEFILNSVVEAGGKSCPPNILGIGIGGSADISMRLAKEALLRPLNEKNPDPTIAQLETEIFEVMNGIGIGPMGLGGKSTLLGVNIEYAYCHTGSLPVAVNFQCWPARRATARIFDDGKIEYLSHMES